MIAFPHDPDHVYFEHSLIRMERWCFEFAIRTPKREKCFCSRDFLYSPEGAALHHAELLALGEELHDHKLLEG